MDLEVIEHYSPNQIFDLSIKTTQKLHVDHIKYWYKNYIMFLLDYQ